MAAPDSAERLKRRSPLAVLSVGPPKTAKAARCNRPSNGHNRRDIGGGARLLRVPWAPATAAATAATANTSAHGGGLGAAGGLCRSVRPGRKGAVRAATPVAGSQQGPVPRVPQRQQQGRLKRAADIQLQGPGGKCVRAPHSRQKSQQALTHHGHASRNSEAGAPVPQAAGRQQPAVRRSARRAARTSDGAGSSATRTDGGAAVPAFVPWLPSRLRLESRGFTPPFTLSYSRHQPHMPTVLALARRLHLRSPRPGRRANLLEVAKITKVPVKVLLSYLKVKVNTSMSGEVVEPQWTFLHRWLTKEGVMAPRPKFGKPRRDRAANVPAGRHVATAAAAQQQVPAVAAQQQQQSQLQQASPAIGAAPRVAAAAAEATAADAAGEEAQPKLLLHSPHHSPAAAAPVETRAPAATASAQRRTLAAATLEQLHSVAATSSASAQLRSPTAATPRQLRSPAEAATAQLRLPAVANLQLLRSPAATASAQPRSLLAEAASAPRRSLVAATPAQLCSAAKTASAPVQLHSLGAGLQQVAETEGTPPAEFRRSSAATRVQPLSASARQLFHCSPLRAAVAGGSTVPAARAAVFGGSQLTAPNSHGAARLHSSQYLRRSALRPSPDGAGQEAAEQYDEDCDASFEPCLAQKPLSLLSEQLWDQYSAGRYATATAVEAAVGQQQRPPSQPPQLPLQLPMASSQQQEEQGQEASQQSGQEAVGDCRPQVGLQFCRPVADPAEWLGVLADTELYDHLTSVLHALQGLYGRQWGSPPVLASLRWPPMGRLVAQLETNALLLMLPVEAAAGNQSAAAAGAAAPGPATLTHQRQRGAYGHDGDSVSGGETVVNHLQELSKLEELGLCDVGGSAVVDAPLHSAFLLARRRPVTQGGWRPAVQLADNGGPGSSSSGSHHCCELVLMRPDYALELCGHNAEIAEVTWDQEISVLQSNGSHVTYCDWYYTAPQKVAPAAAGPAPPASEVQPPPVAVRALLPQPPVRHEGVARLLQDADAASRATRAAFLAKGQCLQGILQRQGDHGEDGSGGAAAAAAAGSGYKQQGVTSAGCIRHSRNAKLSAKSLILLQMEDAKSFVEEEEAEKDDSGSSGTSDTDDETTGMQTLVEGAMAAAASAAAATSEELSFDICAEQASPPACGGPQLIVRHRDSHHDGGTAASTGPTAGLQGGPPPAAGGTPSRAARAAVPLGAGLEVAGQQQPMAAPRQGPLRALDHRLARVTNTRLLDPLLTALASPEGLPEGQDRVRWLAQAEEAVRPAWETVLAPPEMAISEAVEQLRCLDPMAASLLEPLLKVLTPFMADMYCAPMLCRKLTGGTSAVLPLGILFCPRDVRFYNYNAAFGDASSGLFVLFVDCGSRPQLQQQALAVELNGSSGAGGCGIAGARRSYSSAGRPAAGVDGGGGGSRRTPMAGGHQWQGAPAVTATAPITTTTAAAGPSTAAASSPATWSCRLQMAHQWAGSCSWADLVEVAAQEGAHVTFPKGGVQDLGCLQWATFAAWHQRNTRDASDIGDANTCSMFLEFPGKEQVKRALQRGRQQRQQGQEKQEESDTDLEPVPESEEEDDYDDDDDFVLDATQRPRWEKQQLRLPSAGAMTAAAGYAGCGAAGGQQQQLVTASGLAAAGCTPPYLQQLRKLGVCEADVQLYAEALRTSVFQLEGENGPLLVSLLIPDGQPPHYGLLVCPTGSSYSFSRSVSQKSHKSLRVLHVAPPTAAAGSSSNDVSAREIDKVAVEEDAEEAVDVGTFVPASSLGYYHSDSELKKEACSGAERKCATVTPHEWVISVTRVKKQPHWRSKLQVMLPLPQANETSHRWVRFGAWEKVSRGPACASGEGATAGRSGATVPAAALLGVGEHGPRGRKRKGGVGPSSAGEHKPTITKSSGVPGAKGANEPTAAPAENPPASVSPQTLEAVEVLKRLAPALAQQALGWLARETRQLEGRNAPVVLRVRCSSASSSSQQQYEYGIGFCPDGAWYGDGGQGRPTRMRVLYLLSSSCAAQHPPAAVVAGTTVGQQPLPTMAEAGGAGTAADAGTSGSGVDVGAAAAAAPPASAAGEGGAAAVGLVVLTPIEFLKRAAAGAQGSYHWTNFVRVLVKRQDQPQQEQLSKRRRGASQKTQEATAEGFTWPVYSEWLKTLP